MLVKQDAPLEEYTTQASREAMPLAMQQSPSLMEVIATQPEFEMPTEVVTTEALPRATSISPAVFHPQVVDEVMTSLQDYEMPTEVIATEATTVGRTSISSTMQPSHTVSEACPYPQGLETPAMTTEALTTTRRASITMQQPLGVAQVISLSSEHEMPVEAYVTHMPYQRESIPPGVQPPLPASETLMYSSE